MAFHRIAVEGRCAGQQIVNVFHVHSTSISAQQIATAWVTELEGFYTAGLSSAYQGVGVTVTDLTTMTQGFEAFTSQGAIMQECCPPQAAGVISWKTAQIGRKNRGRTYMPAIPETSQNAGTLAAGIIGSYEAFATAYLGMAEAYDMTPVVYHRATGQGTNITAFVIRPTVYTIRRRTLGRGS